MQPDPKALSSKMDPPAALPKKFSFFLNKKNIAQIPPQEVDVKRDQSPASAKAANRRPNQSRGFAHVLGFEVPGKGSDKPKAQVLLSISDGQLEVEGGVVPTPPQVIPCRNPLPLSDYRVRISRGQRREGDSADSRETDPAVAASSTNPAGNSSDASQPPLWGLQEMRKVKTEMRDVTEGRVSEGNVRTPPVKTEPDGESLSLGATDGITIKVNAEPPSQVHVTDEEAAASLLAEARGESVSSHVVPLLARNSVLAELRQKYRGEVERGQRQPQQAGEPDKLLLQRELALLPDAPLPSSSVYEAMPVEEFGAAMLRGMGLKSIPPATPPPKRKAYSRAGLGSEHKIHRLRERIEQRRRLEDTAKREQKTFISLKIVSQAKD